MNKPLFKSIALACCFTLCSAVGADEDNFSADEWLGMMKDSVEKRSAVNLGELKALYGVGPVKKVNHGFLFLFGKYLSPPYRFQRRGAGVYVNGKAIAFENYLMNTESSAHDIEITAQTNAWDVLKSKEYREMYERICSSHPPEKRLPPIVEHLKSLPCTKKVDEAKFSFELHTKDGTVAGMVFDPLPLSRKEINEEKILVLEEFIDRIIEYLAANQMVFLPPPHFNPYQEPFHIPPEEAKGRFRLVVEVSKQGLSVKETWESYLLCGFGYSHRDFLIPPRIQTSPEFWERFDKATEGVKADVMTWDDLQEKKKALDAQREAVERRRLKNVLDNVLPVSLVRIHAEADLVKLERPELADEWNEFIKNRKRENHGETHLDRPGGLTSSVRAFVYMGPMSKMVRERVGFRKTDRGANISEYVNVEKYSEEEVKEGIARNAAARWLVVEYLLKFSPYDNDHDQVALVDAVHWAFTRRGVPRVFEKDWPVGEGLMRWAMHNDQLGVAARLQALGNLKMITQKHDLELPDTEINDFLFEALEKVPDEKSHEDMDLIGHVSRILKIRMDEETKTRLQKLLPEIPEWKRKIILEETGWNAEDLPLNVELPRGQMVNMDPVERKQ
jgi:hypothetical protein